MKMRCMDDFVDVAKEVTEKSRKLKGIFPNYAWWLEKEKVLGIYYTQSTKGVDYAVSYEGLKYAVRSQEAGYCRQSYAVFTFSDDPKDDILFQCTAKDLWEKLRKVEPVPGKIGPFWWVNKKIEPLGKTVDNPHEQVELDF